MKKNSNVVQVVETIVKKVLTEALGYPVKYISKRDYDKYNLGEFPNFSSSGNIAGMKQRYGQDAKLVKCGAYIYNVSSEPDIYDYASDYPIK
jgi:hypothetical protein